MHGSRESKLAPLVKCPEARISVRAATHTANQALQRLSEDRTVWRSRDH